MQPQELEQYLRREIPLAAALGIQVLRAESDAAEVRAPFGPNRNHLNTVFGGSLNAILLLTCYAWLFSELRRRGLNGHVVLKSSHIEYKAPVTGDIVAHCRAPAAADVDQFFKVVAKKGRAKITLAAEVPGACQLTGQFVAQP